VVFRYNDPDFSTANDETLKGALMASVDLGALPFKPKLTGEVAGRSTGSGNTTELKWGVGLALGEFLFPGSSLEARYAQYSAKNVASIAVGATDKAFAADDDRIYSGSGGSTGSLSGFIGTWKYYDFSVSYAEFLTSAGDHARAFRVSYTVRF
jgi:hypothetical protein